MELRQYFAIVRRRWWILVLGAGMAALAAFVISKQITPRYEARATLLLNLAPQPATPTIQDISASQALTKTYARLVTTRPTLEEAARRLGGGATAVSLSGVSGEDVPQTELLQVTFRHRDPAYAARVVNVVAEVFAQRVQEAQIGEPPAQPAAEAPPTPKNSVFIAEPAAAPIHPVSPRTLVNTLLAAGAGLLAAIGCVALLEYLDDTVKGPPDVETLSLTLMGTVQRQTPVEGTPVSVLAAGTAIGPLVESYRQLRTNIEFAGLDQPVRGLVVTSALPGEGKTTTACNLAIMLARAGRQVILVDADLRRPGVHAFFQLGNRAGLTNTFFGAGALDETLLQATPLTNLRALTTGPLPPNPAELLGSAKMATLVAQLAAAADIVVFDTPPASAVADAAIVSAHADATLLVIDAGRTRLTTMRTAIDLLGRSRTRLVGAVLNNVNSRDRGYDYYYLAKDASGSLTPNGGRTI